jgi:hypothetical protein
VLAKSIENDYPRGVGVYYPTMLVQQKYRSWRRNRNGVGVGVGSEADHRQNQLLETTIKKGARYKPMLKGNFEFSLLCFYFTKTTTEKCWIVISSRLFVSKP